ncbi:MAG TPA: low specificity L-threonine aldolase [Bacteroidetes bacterium]|nr:low specificity L-threonine aldolase [Bacteroidota bacterium]
MIDLRSDTVTKPTEGMRKAMAQAEVGDDVFKEDPTMNAFQEKVAEMFDMEAGVFVPSGTMGNQLAMNILTQPGDEVIIDVTGHVYNYESAGGPFLSGIQFMTLKGDRGVMTPELIRTGFRGHNDWDPRTSVISLENTTNKGGGAFYTKENLLAIRKLADEKGVMLHIDGARIWNASVASGIPLSFYGSIADTISVCFSKALGAPIGSMLLCSQENKRLAMRKRKMWGGGMRQVGILAAAADYALDNHYKLLEDDHRRAKSFTEFISGLNGINVNLDDVATNIVLFDVTSKTVEETLKLLSSNHIGMSQFGPNTIRAVFHFQVDDKDLEDVKKGMNSIFK